MSRSTCKVLYVSGEISPFVRLSALADFMASFPQAMEETGCEARIMMPKYGVINDRKFRLHDVLRLSDIEVSSKEKTDMLHVKVTALPSSKIQTYFLYNEKYFKLNGLFSDMQQGGDVKNSLDRLVFFNLGVLETLQRLGWKPDIIHCHDWYAGLVPVLLKTMYADCEFFRDVHTVLTVHNVYRQGLYPLKGLKKLLPEEVTGRLHCDGEQVNLLFTAAGHSDAVTMPSPVYARKVLAGEVESFGFDKLLGDLTVKLHGISNGLDTKQWNPSIDKLVRKKFDAGRLEEKAENKKHLLEEFGMEFDDGVPLVSAVINFERFQGAGLLLDAVDSLMKLELQLVVSAAGDKDSLKLLQKKAEEYKGQLAVFPDFNDQFYHQVMASSDMLVIPAEVESCGMIQFFALGYGTVPVMYDAGGNADTIEEIVDDSMGSGFVFHEYSPESLAATVSRALEVYRDRERWNGIVVANMQRDMTWAEPAEEYNALYQDIRGGEE